VGIWSQAERRTSPVVKRTHAAQTKGICRPPSEAFAAPVLPAKKRRWLHVACEGKEGNRAWAGQVNRDHGSLCASRCGHVVPGTSVSATARAAVDYGLAYAGENASCAVGVYRSGFGRCFGSLKTQIAGVVRGTKPRGGTLQMELVDEKANTRGPVEAPSKRGFALTLVRQIALSIRLHLRAGKKKRQALILKNHT